MHRVCKTVTRRTKKSFSPLETACPETLWRSTANFRAVRKNAKTDSSRGFSTKKKKEKKINIKKSNFTQRRK
jgi:hypothetical protein